MNRRSELHCHTKMSEKTGIADVRELIRTAKKMGMPAIAITDNETVQAFPEAFREWWNILSENEDPDDGIKVLFGAEVGVSDDVDAIVTNDKNQSIKGEYVVIDLETTGLSPVKDRIIEIGAVRIKEGEITDSFASFVNPGIHIPKMITEFTGISDEMVSSSENIEQVLPRFIEFCGDAVLVGHNVSFDISFIKESMERQGLYADFTTVDTLNFSRTILTNAKRHTLSEVASALRIPVHNTHRAVDDSELAAKIFISLLERVKSEKVKKLRDLNKMTKGNGNLVRWQVSHRTILIATSLEGMKNLYELISISHFDYSDPFPKIPRSVLEEHRNGLIIGSCARNGDVSRAALENQRDEDIKKLMRFYDFVEVGPVDNYIYVLGRSPRLDNISAEDVKESIKKIVTLGKGLSVPVIASSDVHYVKKADIDAFRVLRHATGFGDTKGWKAKHHLMTTEEMISEFSFLGKDAKRVVVDNPNIFAEKLGVVQPINPSKNYPKYPKADKALKEHCYRRAHEIYGEELPTVVKSRIEYELKGIKENGFASLYMIAYELVKKSNEAGYIVGSRGTSGASLVSFLLGVSETNPLPAHYRCDCGYVEFLDEKSVKGFYSGDIGLDLPDKICPCCGKMLLKDGYDIPVETFLGFHLDKEPDFDFNFSGDYQSEAQRSVVEIDGIGEICRAGTISTISETLARSYAENYYKDKRSKRSKESISKVAEKLVGVKRADGVHPGGIIAVPKGTDMSSYTPVVPGFYDDIPKTQIEYHALDGALLKLDLLGHNSPTFLKYLYDETGIDPVTVNIEDEKIMSLFSGIEALGIEQDLIGGVTVGTLGIPEVGGHFAREKLENIKPKRYSDIIRISSMLHGTWDCDPFEYIRDAGISISEYIGTRDDIMIYLISKGVSRKAAFSIMEWVRKGKANRYGLKAEWIEEMQKAGIPDRYMNYMEDILYLFPKAHSASYTLMSLRLMYYKLYYPEAFYKGWIKYGAREVDEDYVMQGYDPIRKEYEILSKKNRNKMGYRQQDKENDLLVVMEMYARGIV